MMDTSGLMILLCVIFGVVILFCINADKQNWKKPKTASMEEGMSASSLVAALGWIALGIFAIFLFVEVLAVYAIVIGIVIFLFAGLINHFSD